MNEQKKNIWIFAGETSGDRYGAKLAESLRKIHPYDELSIGGMGGVAMKEAGVDIFVDSTELGVVGLVEVIKHIGQFISIFRGLVKKARQERPDAVILIDYPGFNLRFAKQMYKLGIPVIWYVCPQVWVWGKRRIPKLAKYCRKILVIFPFEVDVFKNVGVDVEFVGHPLVDFVNDQLEPSTPRDPDNFLLLPGSRSSEIERILGTMLDTAVILKGRHPNLRMKISAVRPSIDKRIEEVVTDFQNKNPNSPDFEIVPQSTKLLQECGTGLCKSGTITVECAIVGLPIVIVYKLNPLTFLAAKCLAGRFTTKGLQKKLFRGFFGMPNIIADKIVYEEFLQDNATPENLANVVEKILPPDGSRREEVENEIIDIATNKLTYGKTDASKNAANAVIRTLQTIEKKTGKR